MGIIKVKWMISMREKVKEDVLIMMDQFMKDNGTKEKNMEMEN